MPKAVIVRSGGATITIEGTQDEVVSMLARIEGTSGADQKKPPATSRISSAKGSTTPTALISELVQEGFFREPKELGAVGQALKERGHFYPVTTLSPAMLRLVRKKELRRLKDKKRWTYVG
jgi:hypothetical protein